LTSALQKHVGGSDVTHSPAFPIKTYRELVEHVARLSYANRNQLLFFRGQDKDYQTKAGGSTLYPAIYRGDNLPRRELVVRFQMLDDASRVLVRLFQQQKIEGASEVARKRYIQWSILQHYEVVATPLLDVTHSLRVACSFAQLASTDPACYVYVLGLPYTSNRIAINSEEDVVNIRLLSICPPDALRPYFQEGYMAGTPDITFDFDSKTEVDFRNRLIAKFAIPRAGTRFWTAGFTAMPKSSLYPSGDRIEELCREVVLDLKSGDPATQLGPFILAWAETEERLMDQARQLTERNVSTREAINALVRQEFLTKDLASELDQLRQIRNRVVHSPRRLEPGEIDEALKRLKAVEVQLPHPRPKSALHRK
jgi:hypothetical protein